MARPSLPPLRRIKDIVLNMVVTELRDAIRRLLDEPILFGQFISLTFTAADTPVRVQHSLNGVATRYIVVKSSVNVRDATGEGLWVQADDAGTATVYVIGD